MMSRTPIGGLLLDAADGWRFSVRDGAIAGKLGDQPGVLRIKTLAPNEFPHPLTHDRGLQLVSDWVAAGDEVRLHDRQLMESVSGPFGMASFERGRGGDQVTVWYCTRPAGLILAAYACPADFARTPEGRTVRIRCAKMIGSAVFDRASWGAQDELTKFVISEMAPPNHPAPPLAPRVVPPDPAAAPPKAEPSKRRRP